MTIKEFAYSAQQHIEAQTGKNFKRAHIYELLAASFGYNSYAALCSESVVFPGKQESQQNPYNNQTIRQRCLELGYQATTADIVFSEFPPFISERRIIAITFSAVITLLQRRLSSIYGYPDWGVTEKIVDAENEETFEAIAGIDWTVLDDDDDDDDDGDENPQDHFLLDFLAGLETAATIRNNAAAHYILSLIYIPNDEDHEPGSDYWYNQGQLGRVLTGVEKEWADQYVRMNNNQKKYEFHLREAGRLGNEQALLDLAEKFEDPSFFENPINSYIHNPLRVVEIAENLDRTNDVYKWLVKAAEGGNIEAMLRLIEEFDQGDLQRSWTWIYLAQLLDTDLTRDDYFAIHEDGSPYDDDVGGAMYVDGRDGIRLPPLAPDDDAVARQKAEALFKNI